MSRLSRESSASSQSYTTLPSSLDVPGNDSSSMSYYPSHSHSHSHSHGHGGGAGAGGHHSRMTSMSSTGAGPSASAAYYGQMHDDLAAAAAMGDASVPSSMSTVVGASGTMYQTRHTTADGLAVGLSGHGHAPGMGSTASSSDSSRSYPVQMPETIPASASYPAHHQLPRTSSGAWSPQDDEALIQARTRGENWAQIQLQFPGKTPNACRKRHERLMERRSANDFDTRKMELIAREYMSMRREIWQPLAQRTGEKWTVVEHRCLAAGYKNLQGVARAAGRRERLESSYGGVGNYAGVDMTAGGGGDDELDVEVDVDLLDTGIGLHSPSSSPNGPGGGGGGGNRSVSGASSSSAGSSMHPPRRHQPQQQQNSQQQQHPQQQHQQQHAAYAYTQPQPHHTQPHHPHTHALSGSPGAVGSPGYPEYYTATGFSQSLRGVDGGAAAAAMTSAYAQGHQPRMSGDMGIDALLRR